MDKEDKMSTKETTREKEPNLADSGKGPSKER